MVSLGQKLRTPTPYEKPFYKNVTIVVCKKPLENIKYSKNETILKIGHLARAIAYAKPKAFAKWSDWVKSLKCHRHAKNHSTGTLELFCAKNRSKKHQIFEK